jgi:hypothetical protein
MALCLRAMGVFSLGLMMVLQAGATDLEPEWFEEAYLYRNNNRVGERLSVSFPESPNFVTQSTELVIFEELYFHRESGRYQKRMVGLITGSGMGTTGLKLVLDDREQQRQLIACLDQFQGVWERFEELKEVIQDKTEPWMAESWQALADPRSVGTVYFYPTKKPLEAAFNWDFELNRVWLSVGARIIVDQEVVPYLRHLMGNLDSYRSAFLEYRDSLKNRNQEIDSLLRVATN